MRDEGVERHGLMAVMEGVNHRDGTGLVPRRVVLDLVVLGRRDLNKTEARPVSTVPDKKQASERPRNNFRALEDRAELHAVESRELEHRSGNLRQCLPDIRRSRLGV